MRVLAWVLHLRSNLLAIEVVSKVVLLVAALEEADGLGLRREVLQEAALEEPVEVATFQVQGRWEEEEVAFFPLTSAWNEEAVDSVTEAEDLVVIEAHLEATEARSVGTEAEAFEVEEASGATDKDTSKGSFLMIHLQLSILSRAVLAARW